MTITQGESGSVRRRYDALATYRRQAVSITEVKIKRVTRADLEQRLRECELAHAQATGEELSSSAFFERFEKGEFDTMLGMRWAGYIRALERARD